MASELMPGLSQLEIWEKNDTNEVTFVENMLSLFLVFSNLNWLLEQDNESLSGSESYLWQ